MLAVLTISRADTGATVSMGTRPLAFRVAPVSTISTMASVRERMGASSTLPSILMMSTSIPFSAKKARVTAGYLEATRRVL